MREGLALQVITKDGQRDIIAYGADAYDKSWK